jgi:hypothetical protein
MSKATQYAIDDVKVCSGFTKVRLKGAQTSLQKSIAWIKNLGKGGSSGKIPTLLFGYHLECWKFLSKQGLHHGSSCSKKI